MFMLNADANCNVFLEKLDLLDEAVISNGNETLENKVCDSPNVHSGDWVSNEVRELLETETDLTYQPNVNENETYLASGDSNDKQPKRFV